MKHRCNRVFWTALGGVLIQEPVSLDTGCLSQEMVEVLASPPPLPEACHCLRGEDQPGRKGRYIYTTTWNVLRGMGFSRPLRLTVAGGVDLLVPFAGKTAAVVPQGFQSRVPARLRALALVGKNAALRETGRHLVVCSAVYIPQVWNILERGRCSVCTPDMLAKLVSRLDFSR